MWVSGELCGGGLRMTTGLALVADVQILPGNGSTAPPPR